MTGTNEMTSDRTGDMKVNKATLLGHCPLRRQDMDCLTYYFGQFFCVIHRCLAVIDDCNEARMSIALGLTRQ